MNKPRVFLSHSKKDIIFIKQLYEDLRACQVDPWIDDIEIRPGKPWLDSLFDEGIKACDSVFVYFTEHSINSAVVKMEVDASLVAKFKNNNVAFLPYVSLEGIREKIRTDMKTLQIPLLNETNYSDTFPKIVAEIWRSFYEKNLAITMKEKTIEIKKILASLNEKENHVTHLNLQLAQEKGRLTEVRKQLEDSRKDAEMLASQLRYSEQQFWMK